MPSIDYAMLSLPDEEELEYSDVLIFNEDKSDFKFDLQKLKRYVKFYVKI